MYVLNVHVIIIYSYYLLFIKYQLNSSTGIVNILNKEEATLQEVLSHLERTYCGPLSIELQHIMVSVWLCWSSILK